jgi:hypothetical protein
VLDWRQGGQIYNLDDHYNWYYGTPKATGVNRGPVTVPGLYQSTGKPNNSPISAMKYYQAISEIDEAVVEDGTFIKLRTVGLSYTWNPAALKKTPFRSITVNFTGNNLWIYKPHFTSADPEANLQGSGNGQGVVNYMTPTTRSYILGLRLAL